MEKSAFSSDPSYWACEFEYCPDHSSKISIEQEDGERTVSWTKSIFELFGGHLPLRRDGGLATAEDFVNIFLKETVPSLAENYDVIAVEWVSYDSGADIAVYMVSYSRWLELNAGKERLPVHRKEVDENGFVSYPFVSMPEFGDGDHYHPVTTFYPCRRLLSVCSIAEPGPGPGPGSQV